MKKTLSVILVIIVIAIIGYPSLKKGFKSDITDNPAIVEFTVPYVNSADAMAQIMKEPGTIIDVRTKEEFDNGHLAIADMQLDFLSGEFAEEADGLDKTKTYYLYCRSGNRSERAAKILTDKGFKNVYNIGGYPDLVKAGFETAE